ncbi:hypothetical protein [Hydrocarboniphaga sp.]|uniref:hypothetical protein n=1 Tax=Hydrocarboniphaga sp. TaxID=2033016 RepID=UPI003D0A20D2
MSPAIKPPALLGRLRPSAVTRPTQAHAASTKAIRLALFNCLFFSDLSAARRLARALQSSRCRQHDAQRTLQ